MPLLLLLLGTVALSIFETVWLFQGMYDGKNPKGSHALWSFLLYTSLPLVLDIILSGISEAPAHLVPERVYADHTVQWISRLIIIVWRSAIPPTVCAIGSFIVYLVSQRMYQGEEQMWYPTLQAMTGKLYVLSYFYNLNTHPLFVSNQEQPPTHVVTLTVPALHTTSTSVLNAPEEHPSETYTDSFGRADGAQ
ncbi:hypothetical protein EDB84DRAFT_1622290 [Lactarius hengduanensis]|nr:hypothetical protein EDB84DRAFT_1622290 [Lactarius hengduanensis]